MRKEKCFQYEISLLDENDNPYYILSDHRGGIRETVRDAKINAKSRGHTLIRVNKVKEYYL